LTAAVGAAPCPGSSPALHCPRMPWLLRPGPRRSNGCRRYSSRQHHRPNNTFHAPFCRTSTTLAGPLKLAAVMKGNVNLWRLLIIYCGSRACTVIRIVRYNAHMGDSSPSLASLDPSVRCCVSHDIPTSSGKGIRDTGLVQVQHKGCLAVRDARFQIVHPIEMGPYLWTNSNW